ncbi:MAG TPA: hypothetical protein VMY40_07555 [Anaerolineae bacterium]|nr:hypothetical protein [Anaerolineae bacterium]
MRQPIFDFSAYVADRTRDFTGRGWVFAEIDDWLADPAAPPYFVITGEPGIGKTAIAARLTQVRDPAAVHFCIARQADTVDPLNFSRSLSHQLTQIDGFAQEILRDSGVRLEARQDIRENYGQAINVQIDRLVVNAPSAVGAFIHAVVEPLKALYAGGFERQLVVLVDALDEAVQLRGPETIVDLLAGACGPLRRLPVRFVLTSRPEGAGLRHFERLRVPHLVLDAGRGENLADVRAYVHRRLAGSPALQGRLAQQGMQPNDFVERIATASRGNFLYLVWLLRAIAEGAQRFDALGALPEGLDGIYREFLRTRRVGQDVDRWRSRYRPVLGALAAAQSPLTAEQLARFTGLSAQEVDDCVRDAWQFLDPAQAEGGRLQLYHQSVADFLSSRERAGEFWVDLRAVHGRIARFYQERHASDWSGCDTYGLRYLPAHLAGAAQAEPLRALLLDFDWLQAKLAAVDVSALLADYDLLPDDPPLCLVRDALRLSAHVLARDRTQLAGQLLGRLLGFDGAGVRTLLEGAKGWHAAPWLRPLAPTLTPPGGPLLRTLTGHTREINGVAVMPDGRRAISASFDGTLIVWDLERGAAERTLWGHTGGVSAVAVTPDGRQAILASYDGTLKVWDLESERGAEERTLTGHTDWVNAVAVTPDGRRAISASSDGTLIVWDLERGAGERALRGHTARVSAVAVTPDGRRAISASGDGTLKVWDLERGEAVRTLAGYTSGVTAVAVTPDGRRAISASADWTLIVWDLERGAEERTLRGHTNWVTAVAVTPDGRRAISGSTDRTLKVWGLESERGAEERTLAGHTGQVIAVAVTPDGRRAISASWDGTLKVWDLERGAAERTLTGHTGEVSAVAVTPDGRRAISASWDGTLIVWDLERGVEERTLRGHTGAVWAVAVTRDGRRAISASWDRTLKVWDLERGEEEHTLTGHTGEVIAVAVTPDGRRAISASWGTLKVWDLESERGAEERTLTGHTRGVSAVAVTPDGRRAISGSHDGTLKVWGLESERGAEERTLAGHTDWVRAVAVTPDGRRAISASSDRTLIVWDLERGEVVATFSGDGGMNACAVAPDGVTIVAGDGLGRVHLLRLEEAG